MVARASCGPGLDGAHPQSLALSCDGSLVCAGFSSGALCAFDAAGVTLAERPAAHAGAVSALLLLAGALWSGGYDGRIRCWRVPPEPGDAGLLEPRPKTRSGFHGAAVKTLLREGGEASDLPRERVFSLGEDATLRGWRTSDGAQVFLWRSDAGSLVCAVLAPPLVFVAAADCSVCCLRLADGGRAATLRGHSGLVWAMLSMPAKAAVTPGVATLWTGGGEGTVRGWRGATGACVRVLRGHRRPVTALALWPPPAPVDGSAASSSTPHAPQPQAPLLLFSAAADGVRAWSPHTGECTLILVRDAAGCLLFVAPATLLALPLPTSHSSSPQLHGTSVLSLAVSSAGLHCGARRGDVVDADPTTGEERPQRLGPGPTGGGFTSSAAPPGAPAALFAAPVHLLAACAASGQLWAGRCGSGCSGGGGRRGGADCDDGPTLRGRSVARPAAWGRPGHRLWPPAFRAAVSALVLCLECGDGGGEGGCCAAAAVWRRVGGDTRDGLLDAVVAALADAAVRDDDGGAADGG